MAAVAAAAAFGVMLVVASGSIARADDLLDDKASGLSYLQIVTGGAAATDPLPLVVAIHGLGDNPQSFRLLLDELPSKARLIFPRGPMPHGEDGFSWFDFHPDDEDDGGAELGKGIQASAERIAQLIVALTERYHGPSRAIVCGFSQGGMLSFALAAEHPELVAVAIPVSGELPQSLWPAERSKVRPLPKIIALHGENDKLVPVIRANWSVEALKSNGYDAKLKTWPGVSHALSHEMRIELISQVVSALSAFEPPPAAAGGELPAASPRQDSESKAGMMPPPAAPQAPAQQPATGAAATPSSSPDVATTPSAP
jgi:phospholipase/carboxylesterase